MSEQPWREWDREALWRKLQEAEARAADLWGRVRSILGAANGDLGPEPGQLSSGEEISIVEGLRARAEAAEAQRDKWKYESFLACAGIVPTSAVGAVDQVRPEDLRLMRGALSRTLGDAKKRAQAAEAIVAELETEVDAGLQRQHSLEAQLALAKAEPGGWQPIATAPKDYTELDLCDEKHAGQVDEDARVWVGWFDPDPVEGSPEWKSHEEPDGLNRSTPTHFRRRPLPPPPAGAESAGGEA